MSMLSVVISRCTSDAARSAISCLSGCRDRSQTGFGIGRVGWKNFACRETSPRACRATSSCGCRSTFEPNSLSNHDVVRSLVEVEVTCMLSHKDVSSFQSDNF